MSDEVTLTIDGKSVTVPRGTVVMRAAEKLGIDVPRFCDHPLLAPVGACRQCMVEVPDGGNGRGFPKPQSACSLVAAEGMVVKTQYSSQLAHDAQEGIMELLLINHPLDCPICDKGGECPLQNQAMSVGRGATRFDGEKRHFATPVDLVSNILIDRERCVLCTRCTRFSEQISGDQCIALAQRGARQQVSAVAESEAGSYFAGNTVQICPVGALTSADYRFQARPFDLVSTETTCEHCAAGCSLRVDHRHSQVTRRLAGEDPLVNEEWNCDKGRFGFRYATERLTSPLVRTAEGELREASWGEAIAAARAGLEASGASLGVLPGRSATVENLLAYRVFAEQSGTENLDFRDDRGNKDQEAFLGRQAGRFEEVTNLDLEKAEHIALVGIDAEDEAGVLFLRLKKAARRGAHIFSVASHKSMSAEKLGAEWIACRPGAEADAAAQLPSDAVVLVGTRAAAAMANFRHEGPMAWVPQRAGDRGAVEAGILPGPDGLRTAEILDAARDGELAALLVGDLDDRDFADPQRLHEGLAAAFTVQLAQRRTAVTEAADVVFPVQLITETNGHFLNWEGRWREVHALRGVAVSAISERRVLSQLASLDLPQDIPGFLRGLQRPDQQTAAGAAEPTGTQSSEEQTAHQPLARPVSATAGSASATSTAGSAPQPQLESWPELMGDSAALDHTVFVGSDRRRGKAWMSQATADQLGVTTNATLTTEGGSITLPVRIAEAMVDGAVWVPTNAPGQRLPAGELVSITPHNEGMEVPSHA